MDNNKNIEKELSSQYVESTGLLKKTYDDFYIGKMDVVKKIKKILKSSNLEKTLAFANKEMDNIGNLEKLSRRLEGELSMYSWFLEKYSHSK